MCLAPKKWELYSDKYLYMNVHRSTTPSSSKMQTTQMFTSRWMEKHNVVYSCKKVLFSHEKAMKYWYTDEPWTHYTKWKKLDTKGYILYDSIYTRHPEYVNVTLDRIQIGRCHGLRQDGKGEWLFSRFEVSFLDDKNILELDRGDGCTRCDSPKCRLIVYFKMVDH